MLAPWSPLHDIKHCEAEARNGGGSDSLIDFLTASSYSNTNLGIVVYNIQGDMHAEVPLCLEIKGSIDMMYA